MGDFGKELAGALIALLAFVGLVGTALGMLLGWWLA